MKSLIKYSGAIVVLLGILCLIIYHFSVHTNGLLVLALVLEVVGILGYIIINRYVD